jgi:hypothetical protein
MGTRHRPEITDPKETLGLRFQGVEHARQSDAVGGVSDADQAPPGKGDRLVTDAQHGRVFQPVAQDVANLALIDALDDGGDQHGVQSRLGQMVERLLFDRPQVAPPQSLVRGGSQAVELQVDGWPVAGQLANEIGLLGQP